MPKALARSHQITIPALQVPVGQFSRTSSQLPSDADQVQLILQQGADWGNNTSLLIWTFTIEYAADGVNFGPLSQDPTFDVVVPAKFGHPAGQLSYGVTLPDAGLSTRKVRFTLDVQVSRAVTGGTLDVL